MRTPHATLFIADLSAGGGTANRNIIVSRFRAFAAWLLDVEFDFLRLASPDSAAEHLDFFNRLGKTALNFGRQSFTKAQIHGGNREPPGFRSEEHTSELQ